jgi:hypothetical protein
MNFITKKVLEMQYKKLDDSKKRLNQHLEKRELLIKSDSKELEKIEKEIKKIEDKES